MGEDERARVKCPRFFGLVGNIRLWLGETAEDGSAWTAGVSYAEELPEENLFQLTSRNRREPTIGFRYVVGEAKL